MVELALDRGFSVPMGVTCLTNIAQLVPVST